MSGIVSKAVQDGRFVTVKADNGTELQLPITVDTDVSGISDRNPVKTWDEAFGPLRSRPGRQSGTQT